VRALKWKLAMGNIWWLHIDLGPDRRLKFGEGFIEIWIEPLPDYCDRGDWIIRVSGINHGVDAQDGFPRYLFGTADEAKAQMEMWLNRRRAFRERRCLHMNR
jgi:hypothetical protein